MKERHSCWTTTAVSHPWVDIKDVACGYHMRLVDARCAGCHRAREEGLEDQLRALKAKEADDANSLQ